FTYGIATVTYVVVMSPSPALVASGKTCGRPTPAPGLPRGRTDRYDVRAPGPERGRIMTGPDVTRTAANVPAVRRPGQRIAGRGQRQRTGARPGDPPERHPSPATTGGNPSRTQAGPHYRAAAMDADAIADHLLRVLDAGASCEPVTDDAPGFGVGDAYAALAAIRGRRGGAGWRRAGRKIGFTNRGLWEAYGVDRPFWADVWDRTVV